MIQVCDRCETELGSVTIDFSVKWQSATRLDWVDPRLVQCPQRLRAYCGDCGWQAGRRLFGVLGLTPVAVASLGELPVCRCCKEEPVDEEAFGNFVLESRVRGEHDPQQVKYAAPTCSACSEKIMNRFTGPSAAMATENTNRFD